MANWNMISLPDSASPLMEQLAFFHDHSMLILAMITVMVGYLMMSLFFNTHNFRYLLESQSLEIIWTILPAVTLIFIALPSIRLLYLLDEIVNPMISIKTIGHQWYWSYEYSDFKTIEFDSYMKPMNELKKSDFRLLDVDNRMVVPLMSRVRMMVTAADVIHSWTIPTLGVKIDATPGRLNQISFSSKRPGLMFGQCSEICGANHSFMPIVMESISVNHFIKWLMNN
uniref:Cytochrome c oxidase subunit 2 n=1 Tax=Dermestes peruvianus TaxID=295668 RepID=S4SUX7_DERPE|nr:cytochrome c oxidase subunit II [Dermestes peruvianus]